MYPKSLLLALLCSSLISFGTANAEKLYVANNGVDEAGCGTTASPCRSITRGISEANPADTIIVGPGRYGDLDQDGSLGGEGEESGSASDDAMIVVDKPLQIVSRDGAALTLIDGESFFSYTVRLKSSSVVLGKREGGFTIKGGNEAAIKTDGSGSVLRANRAVQSGGIGIDIGCGGGSVANLRVLENSALANSGAGIESCTDSSGITFRGNEASYNGGAGMNLFGNNHKVFKNISLGNASTGIAMDSENGRAVRNYASANYGVGIHVGFPSKFTAKKNAAIGNTSVGIFFGGEAVSFTRSNTYGNNEAPFSGQFRTNCGLWPETSDPRVDYSGNYYGGAAGAGSNSADSICSNVVVDLDPASSSKEIRIKLRSPQQ